MAGRKAADASVRVYRTVIALIIVFIVGVFAVSRITKSGSETAVGAEASDKVVKLADCLTEKGARMFGSYWCSHCQQQKKDFGTAFSNINYVECSTPDNPRAQAKACEDAGVQSYPTWMFADGSMATGEQSFADLAERSGCDWTE
jgi:hypothetical protein